VLANAGIRRTLLVMLSMLFVIPGVLLAVTNTMDQIRGLTGGGAETGNRQLAPDTMLSQSENTTTQTGEIIPADRITTWNPGLNAVGGIPNRTTIYQTLSPRGGSLDDTAAIQRALDACPPGQVVKLSPGTFNINGSGLYLRRSDCTLRGSGTGALGSGDGGTRLIKADRDTNRNFAILYVGNNPGQFSSSINLAADAIKGANSLTLVSTPRVKAGDIVLVDQVTDDDPRVWWGPQHDPPGGGSRRWFARQDRSLAQIMEVTAVNGNTVTFSTPFHITYKAEYAAQLSRYANQVLHGVGVEDLYVYGGMGGDGHGNLSISLCAYCWVRNIEAHWSVGTSVGFYATFRSVLRDSYIHETPDPNPGGAGYLVGLNLGASDNLVENNVMWNGNKNIVMRATGGGNVIAYNYMDDSYGAAYPHSPEAGLNAGHYTTPHMELLEGNYSDNYKGDSYWGNSIYITVFRNWLSALRAARSPLNTYTFKSGNCIYKYGDYSGRVAVDVQAFSNYTNFVGNILGTSNQQLLGYNSNSCFNSTEVGWTYENLHRPLSQNIVPMWNIGALQTRAGWQWVSNAYETQLRQGNWDWVTKSQIWYHSIGATGSSSNGTPQVIPGSLYLTAKPAFFGSNPWPWVNPSNGSVTTLPAKACLEQGKMPTCMIHDAVHPAYGRALP
jgi:hypothetical protein